MHTDRKKPEVTTAIIIDKRFPRKKDGRYPVKLRVTYQRKQKYYAIIDTKRNKQKEAYTEKEFANIFKQDSRGKNRSIRKKLDDIEYRAIDIIDSVLNEFSFEAFEREYLNHRKKDSTIEGYFETKAKELEEANKLQSAILYRATLKSLILFDEKVSFQKITPSYLEKYEKSMLEQGKSYTTVGIYMRNLKHIINRAIKDRIINEYPFGRDNDKYSIPQGKNTKKALTLHEIELLVKSNPQSPNEALALKYWLFSYLCNGMNMIDIANLKFKNIDGNTLIFIRQKTKGTSKEMPEINVYLLPEALKIIDEIGNLDKSPENYVFPIFKPGMTEIEKYNRIKQHIKTTNKYMRRLAKRIGIEKKITTYFARHSYSTVLKRSGAPIEFISEQLGHQSMKVTKAYLDSFEDEQRAKYSKKLMDFSKRVENE